MQNVQCPRRYGNLAYTSKAFIDLNLSPKCYTVTAPFTHAHTHRGRAARQSINQATMSNVVCE